MEQQTVEENSEQPQQTEEQNELDEQDRQFMAQFARRVRSGEKLAEIFGMDDEQLETLEALAYRLYRNRQFDQARVACRGILALDEDRVLTQLMLGDVALEQGQFGEAIPFLEEGLAVATEDESLQFAGCAHAGMLAGCAGIGDWERFDHHLAEVARCLAETDMVDRDLALSYQWAGEEALAAEERERARKVLTLAVEQWEALDERERVHTIEAWLDET